MTLGCGAAPLEDAGESDSKIIGGVDAKSPKLDAIGSLIAIINSPPPPPASPSNSGGAPTVRNTPQIDWNKTIGYLPDGRRYVQMCTGTIIAEKTVLTAKHCVTDLPGFIDLAFAVGYDIERPRKIIPIVHTEHETTVPTNTNGLGSDVGIAYLGEPVSGLDLYTVGTLTAADLNKRFNAVGYGSQNLQGASGTRKTGSLTLKGTSGKLYEAAFGSFEAFKQSSADMFGGVYPDELLQQVYDQSVLLDQYEAYLGNTKGDVQPCHGDSGGPLVGKGRKVYGVASYVLKSNGSTFCDYGVVYGTFGPAAMTMIDASKTWVDACNGIDTKGACEGDEAVRCTGAGEGTRRLTRTDCSILGQRCVKTPGVQASCAD